MTPLSASALGARIAIPRTNASQDEAEDDMAKVLLLEDAPAPERPDVALAAARVLPVGDDPERVQGQVLRERERDREAARPDPAPPEDGVEHEPEDRAVGRMHRVSRRPPATAGRDELAEQRDVAVVGAEEPRVQRLDESPHRRRRGAGGSGADVSLAHGRHAGKPRAAALRWPRARRRLAPPGGAAGPGARRRAGPGLLP